MKFVRSGFVVLMGVVLVACGGGGGSDGSSLVDDNNLGSEAPAVTVKITTQNAKDLTKAVVSGEGTLFDSEPANVFFRSVQPHSKNKFSIKYITEVVLEYSDASGLPSLARSTRATEITPCDGGGTMSISDTGTEENGNLTVIYESCSMLDMTFDGTISVLFSSSNDGAGNYQFSQSLAFSQVTVSAGDVSVLLDGTFESDETYTAENNRTVGTDNIPTLSLTVGSETFKIYNAKTDWDRNITDGIATKTWIDIGVFADSSLGVFSFDTLSDFEQTYRNYPNAGKIKIAGLNSSLFVTIVDSTSVLFELDSDGDDVIDETWNESPSELGFQRYPYPF